MAKSSATRTAHPGERTELSPDELHFDLKNPRLVETSVAEEASDDDVLQVLWKEMAVEEVAISIAANGYFPHEPLFVIEEGGRFVVIEGNRRLAAVKILLNDGLRKRLKTDLPAISQSVRATLRKLPVVLTTRRDVWQYIGFKHVNGPRPWGAMSKARYIARVHNEHRESLEDISRLIGDTHATVRRLYRGLMVIEQADKQGVWRIEDRWNKRLYFSHLYTGLSYEGFQRFLGMKEATSYKANPIRGTKNLENLGELCTWLFGSKSEDVRPLIKSQNPDLRHLDETLQTERGVDALRSGMPLEAAYNVSRGDERIFRESLTQAKTSLQRAAGTVLTGYDGKSDLFEIAEDIYQISGRLLDDMDDIRSSDKKRAGRGQRRSTK